MSTSTTHPSTYGRYIGRVGALAAALGIGMLVVTSPGVAAGDATGMSSTSSANSTSSETSAGESSAGSAATSTTGAGPSSTDSGADSDETTTETTTSGATSSSTEVATGVTVGSSGGAHTSTTNSEDTDDTDGEVVEDTDRGEGQEESSESTDPEDIAEPGEETTPPASSTPEHSGSASGGSDADSAATGEAETSSPDSSASTVDAVSVVTTATGSSTETTETNSASTVTVEAASSTATFESATTAVAAAVSAPVEPVAQVAGPVAGVVGFFNQVVTNLLNPFLAPAPDTPEPFTPMAWAVLAWVRRNLFNQAPVIGTITTTTQTGQTVTGNITTTDPEGDALTYRITKAPEHGTLTIDQATGEFTYTPHDINYTAVQTDTFTVSVTDGKFNVLSLFSPRADRESIGVDVLNPTVERVILDLPDGYTDPDTPRFAADGESLYFSVTPPGGARQEVHQINVDGTNLQCITCGLSPDITVNLDRVVPAPDGRVVIQVDTSPNSYVIYEPTSNQLVPVITPPAAARVLDPQREMRISPDGNYVVFSQIQLGQTGNFTAVPVVGRLVRATNAETGAPEYHIEDARVVYPVGEAKQWTPDGKGVIITGGEFEMGNVDNILVDLETGEVTRLNGNLDYDEDIDMSPNGQWIAVGSMRTYGALAPMTRIVRPAFLPAHIQGAVYEAYRGTGNSTNVTNQEWLVAIEDDLKRENGIPLFAEDDPNTPEDEGDNYNARSMASWNADGTAVAFWETAAAPLGSPNPGVSRLVIANLKYTTSVGTVQGDLVTPHPDWAPKLSESVPTTGALPPVGTYAGAGGGSATITEIPDPTNPGATLRTVTYDNYVNEDGMILNGTESTSATASQNTIRYVGDITVTGTHTGYLSGDVTINKLTRTITPTIVGTNTVDNPGSMIRSSLDGDLLVLLDPTRIAATRTNA